MSDKRDDLDEATVLAAEYAAGLLAGADLTEARRRVAAEPGFSRDVARWRGWLAGLHDEVQDVAPPAALWARIEAAAGQHRAANDNERILRRKLTLWRSATAGLGAVAAVLATILLIQPRPSVTPRTVERPVAPPMVAMVGDEEAAKVMVSWDPAGKQLVLATAGQLRADASHSHELWVIPTNGTPRSLGVMAADKPSHKRIADALAQLLQQGATIAISVEPRGGSPTGKPTGPVVASGALHQA